MISINSLIPGIVKRFYRKVQKKRAHKKLNKIKNSGNSITKEDILETLKKQGVVCGDNLLVHSSLSGIGYVEGGPQTVIDALLEAVNSPQNGTLLLPAFPNRILGFDYLESKPVFDVKNTPSGMGIITELFRKNYPVNRSLHPTHSVMAYGPNAIFFTQSHYGQLTPFNKFSPFFKLTEQKGKILLLGVKLDSLTNFHVLEDEIDNFPYPVYAEKIFEVELIDHNGISSKVKTKAHNPQMSVKRRCNELEYLFLEGGSMKKFKMGIADCYLLDAELMKKNMLDGFINRGITMYTPNGI